MHVFDMLLPEFITLNLGNITSSKPITQGLSQQCFEVFTDSDNRYIVKMYRESLYSSSNNTCVELLAYQAFKAKFTPTLIGHTEHLLVLEKLTCEPMCFIEQSTQNKLSLTLLAASKLHELPIQPDYHFCKSINFRLVFNALMNESTLETQLAKMINEHVNTSIERLNNYLEINTVNPVICHGDLNFGNVFYDENKKNEAFKLIDFESLCLMPKEYDIAMMLAVNCVNINKSEGGLFIAGLALLNSKAPKVDKYLIGIYYNLSLLINGLWYLNKLKPYKVQQSGINDSNRNSDLYFNKAIEQFTLLDDQLMLNLIKSHISFNLS